MPKSIKLLAIVSLFSLLSCSKTGSFWEDYRKDFLKENKSEQSGWGGHRALHWSGSAESFNESDVLSFAKKHGWEFVEKIEITESELSSWEYMKQPIFPLSHEGFEVNPNTSSSTFQHFPRWIKTGLKVYSFETGVLAIQPGTDEELEVNGFVLISKDSKEMSAYHLWGE